MFRLLLPLLFTGCGYPEPETSLDGDGDHWTPEYDCDDNNPEIHPYADELCNGLDDDCDGEIDEEGASDATDWYPDGDGDGYGADAYPWALCNAVDGYIAQGGDCDDQDAAIYPTAIEICDGVDNDCDGSVDESGTSDEVAWYRDGDGDGYGDPNYETHDCVPPTGYVEDFTDCDDGDAAVHPGAQEVCDDYDTDEDCDGLVDGEDPDATNLSTFYEDADGDTHGSATGAVISACDAPSGFSDTSDDCDDTDRTVNPSARERCGDGIDNDCDGLVDGADSAADVSFYYDDDADGYGDPDRYWGEACDNPGGVSTDSRDCDDADASIHPDAAETWYDGVDSDCDGESDYDADMDGYDSTDWGGEDCDDADASVSPGDVEICDDGVDNDCDGVVDACSVTATFQGATAGDLAGVAVSGAGDFNGDGYGDLIIGADREDAGGAGAGAAYVFLGPVSGDLSMTAAGLKLVGEETGDHAGFALAGLGDTDGDGYDDLLVGAYTADFGGVDSGGVWLWQGPGSGAEDLSDAAGRYGGEAASDAAGIVVGGGGDVDGDGLMDMILGASGEDSTGAAAGAAYLLLGPATGSFYLWSADAKFLGEQAGDQAGSAVAIVGDTDGDGLSDMVVGAPYEHGSGSWNGAAYLILGEPVGTSGLDEAAGKRVGVHSADLAGFAVAGGGDVNADGYMDVLVGAPEYDGGGSGSGGAFLILGPWSEDEDLSLADAILVGEGVDDQAGCSVAIVGDLNRDGNADMLIGARSEDSGGSDAGAASIILGPVSGTFDLASAAGKLLGETAGDWLGASVSGAGDVDGDGVSDMIVGAPYYDASKSADIGMSYLILGGSWP